MLPSGKRAELSSMTRMPTEIGTAGLITMLSTTSTSGNLLFANASALRRSRAGFLMGTCPGPDRHGLHVEDHDEGQRRSVRTCRVSGRRDGRGCKTGRARLSGRRDGGDRRSARGSPRWGSQGGRGLSVGGDDRGGDQRWLHFGGRGGGRVDRGHRRADRRARRLEVVGAPLHDRSRGARARDSELIRPARRRKLCPRDRPATPRPPRRSGPTPPPSRCRTSGSVRSSSFVMVASPECAPLRRKGAKCWTRMTRKGASETCPNRR